MMKHFRTLCALTLAAALLLGLCVPAFAEVEPLDDRLEQITQTVKSTLGLDTEGYTEFYGDYYEDVNRGYWELNWYNDNGGLNVTADKDGKVLYYGENTYNDSSSLFRGFRTVLPASGADAAEAAVMAFLDKVLAENETARITFSRLNLDGDDPSLSCSGAIDLNGLPAPISFDCSVQMDDLRVRFFSRSDAYETYVGQLEAPSAATADPKAAEAALQDTVSMTLMWVLDYETGQARLGWMPELANYAVPAATGELVDLDALYEDLRENGIYDGYGSEAPAEEAAAADKTAALTEAEQATISNLEGVLSIETMDAAMRGTAALGLTEDYAMTARYWMDQDTQAVRCQLTYVLPIESAEPYGLDEAQFADRLAWGQPMAIRRIVTLDAMTGALEEMYTYYPCKAAEPKLDDAAMTAIAQDFRQNMMKPDETMGLFSSRDGQVTFCRQEQGYPLPDDGINITVNPVTGTVDDFYTYAPDLDVTFGSAKDPIDEAAARDALFQVYKAGLQYVTWPVAIDLTDPVMALYGEYGYSYVQTMKLAYLLSADEFIYYVDALIGEVITENYLDTEFAYTDLAGCYGAPAVEALAAVGVGVESETFCPLQTATQDFALELLLRACGESWALWDEADVRQRAEYYGFIARGAYAPAQTLTRMDMLKMILNATEYGKAAALSGAYYCSFGDEGGIQKADYGYVSIAQALGLVHGDTAGDFRAYDPCTRQDAAIMIYNFMSR